VSAASRKALLIQPPIEDFYTTPIRLYPLGILSAAAVLEKAGWTVRILDCLAPPKKRKIPVPGKFSYLGPYLDDPLFFKHYHRFGLSDDEILARTLEFSPDLIGISSQYTAYFKSVEELARLLKANLDVPVVLGGHHATVFAGAVRERLPLVDAVLEGPAESALPGFLSTSGALGERRAPPEKASPADWKTLRPAHHLVAGPDYRIGRRNAVSLSASRGCPHGCEFCSIDRMFGRRVSYREVGHVVEEMRWNHRHKGVRIFNFEDDNLAFDRSWFLSLLEAVSGDPILRGVELTAMNGLCHPDLDEDVLKAMTGAGFRRLNVSYVTRSADLRKGYGRPGGGRDFATLVRAAQGAGLHVTAYVIIGLPGQSYREIKDSLDDLFGLGALVGPSAFYLPPGSPIFEKIRVPADVRDDWDFYRSSAFAVETETLSRPDLVELFLYARRRNLERRG
jgi:anaerobic magnesium-protoporphyrin IX monomethyl ester cyclase